MDEGIRVSLRQDTPIPLDVELNCAPGEVLALTGPSGGGKSTILRAIAGLYTPKQGRVFSGQIAWFDSAGEINLPAHKRSAGLVFQNYALFPHLDALGNVVAAMDHLSPPERTERARTLLEMMHLRGLEGRRPAQLSGGQQQRVALARAMARDPQVLLLDEPFSAVDKMTRGTLYDELREVRAVFRIPIIFVTHDLDEAAQLADRICLIESGKVLEIGAPGDILTRPATEAAARLAGLKNVFRGQLVAHDGEHTIFEWDGIQLRAPRADGFNLGDPLAWSIPSTHIVLSETSARAPQGASNTLHGAVEAQTAFGEAMLLSVALAGAPNHRLAASLPVHDEKLRRCGQGQRVSIHLPPRAIHLMRASPPR